jgi:hypothetical protein
MMPLSREQIAQLTARRLRDAAGRLTSRRALVGLDGFVDEIVAVVDTRGGHDSFTPVRTIADLSREVHAAAGQSSNDELVVKRPHKKGTSLFSRRFSRPAARAQRELQPQPIRRPGGPPLVAERATAPHRFAQVVEAIKRGHHSFPVGFRGRPRGRSVNSSPSRPAVRAVHRSSPNGRPRRTDSRRSSSVRAGIGSFTRDSQSRGTSIGHGASGGIAGTSTRPPPRPPPPSPSPDDKKE